MIIIYLFLKSFFLGNVAFFGLYSFASLINEVFEILKGCRGGLGGGGERVLVNLSDFEIDTVEDERNKTVFKFEFLFNVLFVVVAGNVDEPFTERILFRLDILSNALGFLPFVSTNKPFGTTSLL
jgi:hypothetical protein